MSSSSPKLSTIDIAFWAVAVTIACGVAFAIPHFNSNPGDQEVYSLAAERVAQGEQFYRPDQDRAFTYPPFCVLYFTPLNGMSETLRRGVWYFVNFLLLAAVVGLTTMRLEAMNRGRGVPNWACFACVLLLSGRFVISPIEYQGHDQVLFLLTLLAILAWSRSSESAAGFWAGLATATKATPGLLLPVFAWNRQWRACGVFLVAVAAATLLPDLLFPSRDGGLWVMSWYGSFVSKVEVGTTADASGAWTAWNFLNQSLAGTVYRLSTPVDVATINVFDVSLWTLGGRSLKILTTLAQVGVLILLARATWSGWTRDVDDRERGILRLGQGAAVICAMLLLSPMSSKAHFCALLLPLAFVVSDFLHRRRDVGVGLALGFVLVFGTASAKDIVGKSFGDVLLAYGSLTWCTLACLLAVTRIVAARSRSHAADVASGDVASGETGSVVLEMMPAPEPQRIAA